MGLFSKRQTEPAPEPEQTVTVTDYVNLTAKNVKVAVPKDELYVAGVYLWEEDGLIRALKGDDVIFEVSKRSKAYKELEPFARTKLKHVVLYKRNGDYGEYYRAGFARETTHKEAFK